MDGAWVILPAYQGKWESRLDKVRGDRFRKNRGKYWMYWLGTAADKTDQMEYRVQVICCTGLRSSMRRYCRAARENLIRASLEPGPPPLLTSKGIVLIYNGADDKLVYRTGIADV